MKKSSLTMCTLFAALLVVSGNVPRLNAQEVNQDAMANLTGHYSARNFAAGAISRSDIDKILAAGVRASSANNRQPWHFTVVQDPALAKRIVSNVTDGNILIIISAAVDGKNNGPAILDCALATQSIYLAAQALGYGSRIYTGPMDTVNDKLKADLGLPSGHSAVALVRIGRLQQPADATSAASARKSLDTMVTYK
ncbi:hypothetical protein FACS1894124_3140 [Spirochaetia bacterium]|nr:hypothetical protein FACS1894124_3140 [Spirochaetia bacterium]